MRMLPLLILAAFPALGLAQLEWIPADSPQMVFAGAPREVTVTLRNPNAKPAELTPRLRLLQLSSASAMPVGEPVAWKTIQLLPGQTVITTATVPLPEIRTGTRFQIQWLNDANSVLAKTDLIVWPTDVLKRLHELAGEPSFGVLDPDDQLKPILNRLKVPFEELKDVAGLAEFHGHYAILGPFRQTNSIPAGLSAATTTAVQKGLPVVWLQTPTRTLLPELTRITRLGAGAIVMAPAVTVENLADSPRSQLNLINHVQAVLAPSTFALPKNP